MKIKSNGFTLIELLAVIVILAIIALIATPIVLEIINDSKESSILRSAEFYIDGVEQSIAISISKNIQIPDGTYYIMQDGNLCIGELINKECNGKILKVEIKGETPKLGSVFILNGQINDVSLNINNRIIGSNNEGKIAYLNKLTDICELKSGESKKAGSKYECKVNAGTKHIFYVLTTPELGTETIDLIMDQNINSDGTPAGIKGVPQSENATKYNLVAWQSSGYNKDGPVTAMEFLYNATKKWTNIPILNYTYNDREYQGITDNKGYTSFISSNGVATITPLKGDVVMIGTNDEPLRARMPIYASDVTITEVTNKENASYLYDNLPNEAYPPLGYWTFSSNTTYSGDAWYVRFFGFVTSSDVNDASNYGVRPVITLKI